MKITPLLIKKFNGTISEKEELALARWLQKSEENKKLYSRLKANNKKGISLNEMANINTEKAWQKTTLKAKPFGIEKPLIFKLKSTLPYAAIFIFLISIVFGFYHWNSTKKPIQVIHQNAITLELDNGEIRILTSDDNINTIKDKHGKILGAKNGNKLDYKNTYKSEKIVYNTLKIPYGETFELTLSDGSVVHLNSGSSLRYPIHFLKGQQRSVFLKGEAFFNVSTDKKNPFVVHTTAMQVNVLGTKFNMSAYTEDSETNTVLVEGSVHLTSTKANELGAEPVVLVPGHKAQWNIETNSATIKKVNTELYTSWITGKIILKNMPFKNIIKKLERRYNITILNNYTELDRQIFTASFDIETIEEVLRSFAENAPFTFQRKNNIITISKPKSTPM